MRRLHPILAGVLVLAGACGGGPAADGGAEDRDRAAGARATSLPSGTAPGAGASPGASAGTTLDFTAPLVGGGTFDGPATAGDDLAVWFWSPW